MDCHGKAELPIDLVSYLTGRHACKLNEENYLCYLHFLSKKQRGGMAETLAIESYTLTYLANQIARCAPESTVILSDGKRRKLPAVIATMGCPPQAVFITAISANFPTAVATAYPLNYGRIPVVIGGIHVSTSPEDINTYIRSHVPHPQLVAQFVGPADSRQIQELLGDLSTGCLKMKYCGETVLENGVWGSANTVSMPPLRLNHLKRIPLIGGMLAKKVKINSVAPFLGCPYRCKFCSISSLPKHQNGLVVRDPDDFVDEITNCWRAGRLSQNRFFFFLPDNLLLGGRKLEAILDTIIARGLKINFAAQISIDVADNKALLNKLRRAGATHFFIGLETLDIRNLNYIGKHVATKIGKMGISVRQYYRRQLKRIRQSGISVHGAFIVGLPYDYFNDFDDHTGIEIADFCIENRIGLQPCTLSDLPGSVNFKESQRQDRFLYGKQGTMDYLAGLCLADLTESNRIPFESLRRSPLLLFYMAYQAIQKVGATGTAVGNAWRAAINGFIHPSGNGRVPLGDRMEDAFWAMVSQLAASQYKEHAEMIAYTSNGAKGSVERLWLMEKDPRIRQMFAPILSRFFTTPE